MRHRRSPLALLLAAVLVAGCGDTQTVVAGTDRERPGDVAAAPASTGTTRASPAAARAAALLAADDDRGEDRPDDPAREGLGRPGRA